MGILWRWSKIGNFSTYEHCCCPESYSNFITASTDTWWILCNLQSLSTRQIENWNSRLCANGWNLKRGQWHCIAPSVNRINNTSEQTTFSFNLKVIVLNKRTIKVSNVSLKFRLVIFENNAVLVNCNQAHLFDNSIVYMCCIYLGLITCQVNDINIYSSINIQAITSCGSECERL